LTFEKNWFIYSILFNKKTFAIASVFFLLINSIICVKISNSYLKQQTYNFIIFSK
jgi:hypothetical protein